MERRQQNLPGGGARDGLCFSWLSSPCPSGQGHPGEGSWILAHDGWAGSPCPAAPPAPSALDVGLAPSLLARLGVVSSSKEPGLLSALAARTGSGTEAALLTCSHQPS